MKFILAAFFIILVPLFVLAQQPGLELPAPPGSTMYEYIRMVLVIVIRIGIPALVIYIIFGGLMLIFSSGNDQQLSDSKKRLTKSLVVAVVILCLLIIAAIIRDVIIEFGLISNKLGGS